MIPCAPITRIIDWWTTSDQYRELHRDRPSELGLEALRVMEQEDGNGEEGGNNRGPHIDRYGGKQGKSWCAAVVYFAIAVACFRLRWRKPFARTNGARALFRRTARVGMLVDLIDIQPGDLVLFDRGDPDRKEDRWKAHIGVVSRILRNADGIVVKWYYRAGNEGRRAVVKEHNGTQRGRLVGFARLPHRAPV